MNTERSLEVLTKSIVGLATALKDNSRDVSVSDFIVLGGNSNLNQKGCEVNAHLTEMYKGNKIKLDKSLKKDQTKSSKSR